MADHKKTLAAQADNQESAAPTDSEQEVEIVVNGNPLQIECGLAVSQLLKVLEIHSRAIAVEINGEIQSATEFHQRFLKQGDRIEIVTLVGGG